jgi:hypothetical protein
MGRSPSGIRVIAFEGAAILFLGMFPGGQAAQHPRILKMEGGKAPEQMKLEEHCVC